MSRHEYEASKQMTDVPFYGLIMAAMRQADTDNLARLKGCWPDVWAELYARYNAPGAVLPGDPEPRAARTDVDNCADLGIA